MQHNQKDALNLLHKYTRGPSLLKHAYAVEAAMRYYSELFKEDKEKYSIIGLLHDFDYERFPTFPEHPLEGAKILQQEGYSDDIVEIIKSHASFLNLPRDNNIKKALFAVDELTGFIIACTLVLPSKKLEDLTIRSVIKKMKRKEFAKAISREDITEGAKLLNIPLEEHIQNVINAMTGIKDKLGL